MCIRDSPYNDRAYIQKIKPFFVKRHIFYEVTFTVANDKASKFDRVIAFTSLDLSDNYAVKLSIHTEMCIRDRLYGILQLGRPLRSRTEFATFSRAAEICGCL